MDFDRGRIVCLLVILGVIVGCVASDNQVCHVDERPNMGLSKILDPAMILSVAYEYHSASDCYHACCNYTGNQCNAVSFYDKESLCMLLSCHPFSNCVWVTADGFMAGRTQLTTVTDDAMPPPPSTTSQGLAEGVPPTTTTTQATPTTTQTLSAPAVLETTTTQPMNADASSNSVEESPPPDGTNSSEVSDWNMDSGSELPPEEPIPIGMSPTVNPELTTTAAADAVIPGDYYSIYNQTDDDSFSNRTEADDEPLMNNDSVSEEEWNVDGSVLSMSDDTSGQANETTTKGRTDDPNGNAGGPKSTEEPWNIDSFLSNNDGQNDNGQPTDLNNGQTDSGQPTDLNNGQPTDLNNGQPTDLNNGQPTDLNNGQPTDLSNGQPTDLNNGQPTDLNNGQPTDLNNGQPTDLNNGQPTDLNNGQPTDLNSWQTDNGQPSDNNNSSTEPSFEDPWIVDEWLLSKMNELDNNGQATNSDNSGPEDNGHTDKMKDDFRFTDDSWLQPNNYNEFTTRSNAGGDSQPVDQQQPFDDVIDSQPIDDWSSSNIDAPLNPDGEPNLEQPVFIPEEDPTARPREMKRMFIQSPGIIIGLCSALGVAFLVLLAVCRKVYLSHDRPRYKPLRDYDIRFEPPAASSALLP